MILASKQNLWHQSGIVIPGFKVLEYVDCDTQDRGSSIWGAYAKTDISNLTRNSWELETTCIMTGQIGQWNFLCGCEYSDNESGYIKIRLYGGPENGGVWEHNTSSTATSPCPVGEVQNITIKNSVATVNSYSWSVNSSTIVNSHYFCIGGTETVTYRSDGYKRVWPGYIGRTKVSQGGVLKGDFVPAKRKSDGVCGFYDLTSKNFYSSATPVPFKEV